MAGFTAVKLVTEYLEQVVHFQRLAGEENDSKLRQQLLDQAENYWRLARKRAAERGLPPPLRPPLAQ